MNKHLAWTVIGALALSACGSESGTSSQATVGGGAGPVASPLPAVEVDDVTNDRRVALDSFVPADRPTLIWFWAPH